MPEKFALELPFGDVIYLFYSTLSRDLTLYKGIFTESNILYNFLELLLLTNSQAKAKFNGLFYSGEKKVTERS